MKKTVFLLFLLFVLFVQNAVAERIPQSKALQIATSFMKNSGRPQQHLEILRTSEDIPELDTKATEVQPKFYIFGSKNDKGFVIVSADDRFSPILGYSLDDYFDADNVPANMQYWFSFLRDQMSWAEQNNITDVAANAKWKTQLTSNSSGKLLTTASWDQEEPYYNQCPQQLSSFKYVRCLTGCVATAVCEVMRYHKWPKAGVGSSSSYSVSSGYVAASVRKYSTYDWDNMPLTTDEFDTTEEKEAVATLMADVGAALQLSYSSDGTSGLAYQQPLVDNFGYNPMAHYDKRDYFQDSAWFAKLKNEIDNNRPIIYDGYDENFLGGHCFVVDGYNADNYIHVNWGWSGSGNGYFLLGALATSSYHFNTTQGAILDFEPATETTGDPENWIQLQTPGLTTSSSTFTKGTPFIIDRFHVMNASLKNFTGKVGLILVDKRGNQLQNLYTIDFSGTTYLYAGIGYYNVGSSEISCTINVDIKPGYRVRAFYLPPNGSEWLPMWRDVSNKSYISQEILVSEDVDLLEYRCSLKMSSGIVTLTIPEGATAGLYNGSSEVQEGVTKTATSVVVDAKKLTRGTSYKFTVNKGSETKEFTFKLKKQ